jgi:N-acetylmuramoyl-L-alanine amidase
MAGVLFATAAPVLAAPLQIASIEIVAEGPATRVELTLSGVPRFQLFTLTDPHRVVVDIPAAALGPAALPFPAGQGAVRQVRAAHRPDGSLRLVFDMVEAVAPTSELRDDPLRSRLSIALNPLSRLADARPSSPGPAPPPAAAPAPLPPPSVPMPAPRPRAVVIAVDAGHGGHDPGALGAGGLREKDVTLAISRRLVELLNAEPGMRAVLTRGDDRFVDLRGRMERARSASADLFISIHADAALNRRARGSTVYVLSAKGATDEASRRLAARENAALIGGVELGDKDPVLASVLMDLSQNASISSSIAVGDAILKHLGGLGSLHRSRVQQAPFMVLKSPDVPSVLVETAYISNPAEERRLRSAQHQQALAEAIKAGIEDYFRANPPGAPAPPAQAPVTAAARHVVRRGDTLSTVAVRYGVSLASLRAANGLRSDTVRVGQTLRIPQDTG